MQTAALFVDAYRELNAKKMFWVVLGLTVLAMLAFSLLGANDRALTFLWFEPLGPMPGARLLYKIIFSYAVVGIWLTWIATILALISTAGIFPDFVTSGSIDLYLSRPIGRLRLFLTKYAAALLFVTLQVTLFAVMSFIILGVRGGTWEPSIFLAIPLVVLFFSYLYSVCVLLGVMTRSTVAALLLTFLVWTGIFLVDYVDYKVAQFTHSVSIAARQEARQNAIIARTRDRALALPPGPEREDTLARVDRMEKAQAEMRETRAHVATAMKRTQMVTFSIKTLMPKTRETINLMDRYLFSDESLRRMVQAQEASDTEPGQEELPEENSAAIAGTMPATVPASMTAEQQRVNQAEGLDMFVQMMDPTRDRSAWWVVGTSILFEALVLSLAAWIFVRRDY
jgi:ABC-type transport system involved in multi-copper enzyme maturation permease subunit